MNAKSLSKSYDALTPEERFRLILAASGRGDELEKDRLARAGKRIALAMEDHAPYAHAFDDVATLTFLDLLDHASLFLDALVGAASVPVMNDDAPQAENDREVPADAAVCLSPDKAEIKVDGGHRSACEKPARLSLNREPTINLALAHGFVLRTLADGWKLFCEGLNVPPFLLWQTLPGFARLQSALAITENIAHEPEKYLHWLNSLLPPGVPAITKVGLTANAVAAVTKNAFRDRVGWWGGSER